MHLNMSSVVALMSDAIITVDRSSPGSYVDGVWVPGTVTTFDTDASVQSPSSRDLLNVPENERTSFTRRIFSTTPLMTIDEVNQTPADIITYNGRTFKLSSQYPWDANGYTEALIVEFKHVV